MNKKEELNRYATKFANELQPRLRTDIQADVVIYPTSGNGAIVEVKLVPKSKRSSTPICFEAESNSINQILKKIPQNFIGGNIDGIQFSGTNISLEGNRILLIKGDNQHWSESDAIADIARLLDAKSGK